MLPISAFHPRPWRRKSCIGQVKISCQKIQRGKLADTVPFNAKVIRNLTKLIGADAVSGKNLSERLADIPAKPLKKKQRVQTWVQQHWDSTTEAPSTAATQTTYPPGTPSIRSCRCDWSNIATHASGSTKCCGHQGLCRLCSDRFADIQEDITEQERQDNLQDMSPENHHLMNPLLGSYEDDYPPEHYLNQDDVDSDASADKHEGDYGPAEDLDPDGASSSPSDSDCGDPENFLVTHHCTMGSNVHHDHNPTSNYPQQKLIYDRHNDRLVSQKFADQAIAFGYDLATGTVDQSRHASLINQAFREAEDDELMQLALQYGYDDR